MRIIFLSLFLLLSGISTYSQTVQGFVINKESGMRLAKVFIYNERTEEGVFNNSKGEFTLPVKQGDVLFAALEGYGVDTIVYKGQSAIYFQLRPLAIQIEQVDIMGKKLNPNEQYLKTSREYKYATDKGNTRDLLNLGIGRVGLGIDAIYNLLSRQGKNARHLQRILERDYKESIIDYRFRKDLIGRMLQLKDPELTDFMEQYRPTYSFVLSATDYTFALFIKNSYASYLRAPEAFRLPPLPRIN